MTSSPPPTTCRNNTKHNHKWVEPSGHHLITVDVIAVNADPMNNTVNVVILIKPGRYIDPGPNGQQLRTYRTASVIVFANYFSARNISFKNTAPAPLPGMQGRQAVAFWISGDKAYFSGCGFCGAQDTLCDDVGRRYFKECYIEGSVDFIFGNGRSMYKTRLVIVALSKETDVCILLQHLSFGTDCELHWIATKFGSIAAHCRNSPNDKSGFAFLNCRCLVGQAMGKYSLILYSYTYFDDMVAHGAWADWNNTKALRGVSCAPKLQYDLAHPFLAKSFVNGRHWIAPHDA
ncbi:pectinesterase 68 [Pyrus ussuriensis x Pyrus communis]|uniref:Pectinesterase n=1 Tax=Pyrus ussuriensis x Pyrus communis TaxID=2448454 RepID=A0A5N5FZJ8_9ROSA|nr:pectinesterase 68 [Pyrus ussuriensis x Pyrus communis]